MSPPSSGSKKHHTRLCMPPVFAVILLGSFFDSEGGCVFLRNVGWLSTDYTALFPGRQNSPLLMSACTPTTQGTSTLNMTNGVTVGAESEFQIHTQHAGSRGKVSRLCSGGSRFEPRLEHRLHWLKPVDICLSSSRDSAVGVATALWAFRGSNLDRGKVFPFYSLYQGRFWYPSSLLSNV
jgi:hypothetical protein